MNKTATESASDSSTTNGRDVPQYSIVIPVFNSEPILPDLFVQLDRDLAAFNTEIILINDGSSDDSWQVLQRHAKDRSDIIAIDLMKNYGQHSAMFCGFQVARGRFIITMDDDLQNPPSEVHRLIAKIEEGYDVVFGRFRQKQHGLIRKAGSKVVGWLNRRLFRKPADLVLSNFRIIRREIVDAVCDTRTAFPYIPGMLLLNGKTFANVDVEHRPRPVGSSNYGVAAIAALIWRIIFNYSALPLRWACLGGIAVSVVSFLLGAFYLIKGVFYGTASPGFPTLVCLLAFCNGVTLLVLALLSEYVVRLVNEVSGIPAYRIRKTTLESDSG
jgi:glycosyltransferase involved in cell wall biosynthesis